MTDILSDDSLDRLFRNARTHNAWRDEPVSTVLLQAIYDLAKMAPTSANCQPMRLLFVTTPEAKARLKPHLSEGNRDKTMAAPVTAIVGHDLEFYEELPRLFPHTDARSWFTGDDAKIADTAFRNGSLQGAYLMIAARALGLDVGPMSGFDNAGVDAEFFAETSIKSNFLCNLGYGDPEKLHERSPRPDFDDFCQIL
ncbi:malonic semialdehyde reductase [Algihabitans sp.]|uniref:malonic semialdehyde reductase n=1 Tax=Algihabitans sp. TaxID=2821514 RepID=UPI003BA9416A